MESFEGTFHGRGNSIGIAVPVEIVKKLKLKKGKKAMIFMYTESDRNGVREAFGSFHFTRSTQEILDELRAEER
jgi:hypothetical protein